MFSGIDKAVVGLLTPWLVKGLSLACVAIGMAPETLDLSTASTVILSIAAGAIVWLIPNKLKT